MDAMPEREDDGFDDVDRLGADDFDADDFDAAEYAAELDAWFGLTMPSDDELAAGLDRAPLAERGPADEAEVRRLVAVAAAPGRSWMRELVPAVLVLVVILGLAAGRFRWSGTNSSDSLEFERAPSELMAGDSSEDRRKAAQVKLSMRVKALIGHLAARPDDTSRQLFERIGELLEAAAPGPETTMPERGASFALLIAKAADPLAELTAEDADRLYRYSAITLSLLDESRRFGGTVEAMAEHLVGTLREKHRSLR